MPSSAEKLISIRERAMARCEMSEWDDRLLYLANKGATHAEMAETLDCSLAMISKRLAELGHEPRECWRTDKRKRQIAEIRKRASECQMLWWSGVPTAEIAKRLKVSVPTVYALAKRGQR